MTKYIIIGIHGLGGRAAWLNRIQEELEHYNQQQSEHQFIWQAHDLPGFGADGDGHIRSFHDWLKAVQDDYESLRVANPDARFVIFGHSLGGVIASNLYEIHDGDALILSVPGFQGAKTTFNPWFVARVILTYFLSSRSLITMPASKTSLSEKRPDARHASPSKRSLLDVNEHCEGEHNNADGTFRIGSKRQGMIRGKLYTGDPTDEDIYKTKAVSANLLWQILQLGKHTERNLGRLRRNPVLMLQVAEDPVVDNMAQDKMFGFLEPARSNKIIIPGALHDWPLYDIVGEMVPKIVTWVLGNH